MYKGFLSSVGIIICFYYLTLETTVHSEYSFGDKITWLDVGGVTSTYYIHLFLIFRGHVVNAVKVVLDMGLLQFDIWHVHKLTKWHLFMSIGNLFMT